MNPVSRDIIIDLLPLYFADEASPASRTLVEDYLAANPDFAETMRASQQASAAIPADFPEHGGHRAIKRIRSELIWRGALIAIGIFTTLVPLSFVYSDHGLEYFMLRDAPAVAAAFLGIAAFCWSLLWYLVRRMNTPQSQPKGK